MSDKKKSGNVFTRWIRLMFLGSNKAMPELDLLAEEQMRSPMRTIIRNFFSKKTAVAGLVGIATIMILVFTLSSIYPLDRYHNDSTQQNISPGFSMLSVPKALKADVQDISVGSTFSVGVDTHGNLYQWGKPTKRLQTLPSQTKDIKLVSAGNDHALAVTNDNEILTWGNNRFKLTEIPKELNGKEIRDIWAGDQFSLALTEESELYFWGNSSLITVRQSSIPKDAQGHIDTVSVSADNIILVLDDGSYRILGIKGTPVYNVPSEVKEKKIENIVLSKDATAALTDDGFVYVWGQDLHNLLNVPEEIQGKTKMISAGRYHFNAITEDNKVYSWGRNHVGQLDIPQNLRDGKVQIVQLVSNYYQNYAIDEDGNVHSWGLKGYLMGTDGYGRDIFRRLMTGGRLTLTVGAVAVLISLVIGVIVGGIAGFYGGKVDMLLMRFSEIMGAIPFLPFAMTLSVVLANNVTETQRILVIMVILGILEWPGLARLVRGQILAEREKEFVTAARAMGIREKVIIFRHILPNVISVVIVNVTLRYATSLLTESSLSFLGFGVVEPSPTWGNMITGSQNSDVIANYWWRWAIPAIAISLSTISINMLGDGLRDAIDPKSEER